MSPNARQNIDNHILGIMIAAQDINDKIANTGDRLQPGEILILRKKQEDNIRSLMWLNQLKADLFEELSEGPEVPGSLALALNPYG